MKFTSGKKESVVLYILEKIHEDHSSISKVTAENFHIDQSTVHDYIKELLDSGVIRRIKRGKYELANEVFEYHLSRSAGDMDNDIRPYFECLDSHIKRFSKNIEHIWSYVFSEMFNNVIDHSNAENAYVTVIQNYLNTTVLLRDDGIGIFRKICDYFQLDSLEDAVSELFKGKLTTDSVNHSGEGIFFSSRMMDEFVIISDETVYSINKYDEERVFRMVPAGAKGTALFMTLSNHTKREPIDIFQQYADVDNGFTKTRIPLKNIFDSAPVSRSQAKRVCSRLENFREVYLDFDSIDWMGQGFAHQIFYVYANEHPEIKLIPENMNDAVQQMYQHVTLK